MDYISIVEIAEQAGVSGNTVIRYLSMFETYFSQFKMVDGIKKYPSDNVALIRRIHELNQRPDNTKQDVLNCLQREFQKEAHSDHDPLSQTNNLGGLKTAIDRLTHAVKAFNPNGIDRLSRAVEKLTDAVNGLPATLAKVGPDSQVRSGDSVLDQLLTTKPDDGGSEPDLLELLERQDEPGQGSDTLDIFSIVDGEGDDGGPGDRSLQENQTVFAASDTIIVPFSKNDYSDYVTGLIVILKDSGMTLKEIKAELETRGLKTLTGLDSWSTGTISNLYNRRMNE